MLLRFFYLMLCVFFTQTSSSFAHTYPLALDTYLIGKVRSTVTQNHQDLLKLGLQNNLGYYEMLEANPQLHPKQIFRGTQVTLPTQFILPNAPREGVVVNLAELRLYLYPTNHSQVMTYPVGIGKFGWETPTGDAEILDKRKDPKWYVPESVYLDAQKRGINIPKVWPAGPKNPLGEYAMRISIPSYDIHGTNREDGVGRRTSAGCIRMLNKDVAELFDNIDVGTKVTIVNQPFKIGVKDKIIYLEAHAPLYEQIVANKKANVISEAKQIINAFLIKYKSSIVDWDKVTQVVEQSSGIPSPIGVI